MARIEPLATLVDSSAIIDVLSANARWGDWSSGAIADARGRGALVINPIVYAEVAPRFTRREELDVALAGYRRQPLPWAAAYLAGRAHATYRRRGGRRTTTLPDFLIGAHAAVAGMRLLTRDPVRYRTYFPGVDLIAPA